MSDRTKGHSPFRTEDIEAALRRAAEAALELGKRTQTPVYVIKDGKIIDLVKEGETDR